jgi:hypothetical protein
MGNVKIWKDATAVAGYAAVSAALVLLLFAPNRPNAGPPQRKHGATASDVAVNGKLVKDARAASGWAVELTAASVSAAESPCIVEASVMETSGSPMARVMPAPRVIWHDTLALSVPGKGQATRRIEVPAKVGAALTAAEEKQKKPDPEIFASRTSHFVQLQASCKALSITLAGR